VKGFERSIAALAMIIRLDDTVMKAQDCASIHFAMLADIA
jgi:hypothetical protein